MLYSLLNTLLLLCFFAFSVPSKANTQGSYIQNYPQSYQQNYPQNYPQSYQQNKIYTPYNQQQYRQQGYNMDNSARYAGTQQQNLTRYQSQKQQIYNTQKFNTGQNKTTGQFSRGSYQNSNYQQPSKNNKYFEKGKINKRGILDISIVGGYAMQKVSSTPSLQLSNTLNGWQVIDNSGNNISGKSQSVNQPFAGIQVKFLPFMRYAFQSQNKSFSFFKPFLMLDAYFTPSYNINIKGRYYGMAPSTSTAASTATNSLFESQIKLNQGTGVFIGAGAKLINEFYLSGSYDVLNGNTRAEIGNKFYFKKIYGHGITTFLAMNMSNITYKLTAPNVKALDSELKIKYTSLQAGLALEVY